MKVKEIIAECLAKMGRENFADSPEKTEEETAVINMLLGAIGITYREIASQYMPLICEENVTFGDKRLKISELKNRILYAVCVKRGERSVPFKTYHDRIAADVDGEATLIYAYMPDANFSLEDELDDARVSVGLMSDGALAQYYFANRVFDLAASYDADFRYKLGIMRYRGRNMRLRGWED